MSKQLLFLELWPRIKEYIILSGGYEVEKFVAIEKTLPSSIVIKDFARTANFIQAGKTIPCTLPTAVQIGVDQFPVLGVLSEEELQYFSPFVGDEASIESIFFGPSWSSELGINDDLRKILMVTDIDFLKMQVLYEAISSNSVISKIDGDPLMQFSCRLAALRLHDLVINYHFYAKNRLRISNIYQSKAYTDFLGQVNYNASYKSIADFIMQSIKRGDSEVSENSIEDIIAFCIIETSEKPNQEPPHQADRALLGQEYEIRCLKKLEDFGFSANLTGNGSDFGADIICEKDGISYLIQCKNHARPIGVKAIQEVFTARGVYLADYCIVLAESGFTKAAHELAEKNSVLLCSLEGLGELEKMCDASR